MRQAAGDDAVGEASPSRDAQPGVVEKGAFAALSQKHLVSRRIVDQSRDDDAFTLQRHRDGELRNAVQEIRGAIERVDDPQMRRVAAFVAAAFLTDKAVARPRLGEFLAQHLLGLAVGGGDEVGGALERHLQLLHLAEVALKPARRLPRGFDHDVEQGGMQHVERLLLSSSAKADDSVILVAGKSQPSANTGCPAFARHDEDWSCARRGRFRQGLLRPARYSSHGLAAVSAAARSSGFNCPTRSSSTTSPLPPALAMRCHCAACTGLAGNPRPANRMCASRFCEIGFPCLADFRKILAAFASSFATPFPLNKATAYSTSASR